MSGMRSQCGIYQWLNIANGKVYIGSSQDCSRRMLEHRSRLRRNVHGNAKFQAAWNKYGESSFTFSMVFTVFDRGDLEGIEQQFLDEQQVVQRGYNLAPTAGNTAGWTASAETRQRMSDAAKRRDNSVQVQAMAAATKGKKRPKYVIEAMQAGRRASPIGEATRKQMSESAKARGSNITPEHQALLVSMAKARARFTNEQQGEMAAMRAAGKRLKEIGEVFGIKAESSVLMHIKKARSREVAP